MSRKTAQALVVALAVLACHFREFAFPAGPYPGMPPIPNLLSLKDTNLLGKLEFHNSLVDQSYRLPYYSHHVWCEHLLLLMRSQPS